jgi:putative acetyltransferase
MGDIRSTIAMRVDIRKIEPRDREEIKQIIQQVMPEMGAGGLGFAIGDAEVDNMYDAYQAERSDYYVLELNGRVIGGGGIAPLQGGLRDICELKKMYFLPEARGKGYGQTMLDQCLKSARQFGYKQCYLETFHTMKDAIRLYERNGFRKLLAPLGSTGHFSCDTFYIIDLDPEGTYNRS